MLFLNIGRYPSQYAVDTTQYRPSYPVPGNKSQCRYGQFEFEPDEGGKATSPTQLPNLIYLFAAMRVLIGLPILPQTVFREWSSVYDR